MEFSKNRTYFFTRDNNEGFASGQTVTQRIMEEFVYSVVFLKDDNKKLVPTGGTVSNVLHIDSENVDGSFNYSWLDIENTYPKFTSPRILPDVSPTAFTGYVLYKTFDGSEWGELPEVDLSPYLTISGASQTYVNKNQLYNIAGNVTNTVVVLDQSTNKIPNSLFSLVVPEIYRGVWNAQTNAPALGNNINNGINPPPFIQPSGHYYIVSTSGTSLGNTFEVGDRVISNGSTWQKAPKADIIVSKVNNQTGEVNVSFLRDAAGGGTDLTKADIETHIADDDRHLTTSAQTFYGEKTFDDIPVMEGIKEKNLDQGIIFQSAIAFSGDPLLRVFEFIDNFDLTGSTTGTSTVPTTYAIKGYIDTKREWEVPHLISGFTYEPVFRTTNMFEFSTTGLTEYQVEVVNNGGDTYLFFDLTLGYEPQDIDFLVDYINSADIIGSGSPREIRINYDKTITTDVPEQMVNKRLFFGDNITTSGSSALYVDIRTIDPYTGNYVTLPFIEGGEIHLVPDYDNMSQYNDNTTYFNDDVTVNGHLKVLEEISTKELKANVIKADLNVSGYKLSKQTNNALIPTDASILSINQLNRVNPTAPNTFIRLPKIGFSEGVIEGTKVMVANVDPDYTQTILTFDTVADKILIKGNATPQGSIDIAPHEVLEFMLVDATSSPKKWIVK